MYLVIEMMNMCAFPSDSPFPMNFSVMTTVRAVRGSQVFLLSLYDSQVRIMRTLHQDVETKLSLIMLNVSQLCFLSLSMFSLLTLSTVNVVIKSGTSSFNLI